MMELPAGYLLPDGWTMKDVLRLDAELLASEGIDMEWLGFNAELPARLLTAGKFLHEAKEADAPKGS